MQTSVHMSVLYKIGQAMPVCSRLYCYFLDIALQTFPFQTIKLLPMQLSCVQVMLLRCSHRGVAQSPQSHSAGNRIGPGSVVQSAGVVCGKTQTREVLAPCRPTSR